MRPPSEPASPPSAADEALEILRLAAQASHAATSERHPAGMAFRWDYGSDTSWVKDRHDEQAFVVLARRLACPFEFIAECARHLSLTRQAVHRSLILLAKRNKHKTPKHRDRIEARRTAVTEALSDGL